MSEAVLKPAVVPAPIPVRELLPWAVFVGLILLLALYFVGAEQGATSLVPGMYVHEFVHDGRHLLGFLPLTRSSRWSESCSCAGCSQASPQASLTFGFAKIVGEPQVDQAISFEENRSRPRRSTGTRTGQPSRKPASVC